MLVAGVHEINNKRFTQMTITPWWRGAVVYQVYPRSMMDANNDGRFTQEEARQIVTDALQSKGA